MEHEDRSQSIGRRAFLQGAAASAVGIGVGGVLAGKAFAEEATAAKPEKTLVKRRVLGNTKVPVSVVTYGGGGLRPENAGMLRTAYEHGITSIDVAWNYGGGKAQLGVGEFFKTFKERDKIFLSTKCSGYRPPRGSKKAILADFEAKVKASLDAMRTDYVDLLMYPHGAQKVADLRNEDMKDALLALKKKGMIKHIGTSSHANYAQLTEVAADDGFYEAFLVVLNICTQNVEKAGALEPGRGRRRQRSMEDTRAALKKAKKKGLGILAMKVANGGFLGPKTDELLAGWKGPVEAVSRHQKLYAYALGLEEVATVVIGIKEAKHLKEAVAIGKA